MTIRTRTAMFNSKAEAERAGQMLVSELNLDRAMIRTSPGEGVTDTGYDKARPYKEKGFFGSIKDQRVLADAVRRCDAGETPGCPLIDVLASTKAKEPGVAAP